ncbi:AMP-binding protein [Microbispora cellulosiformans]|uniref:AMP-binding protein n=1 Tax=Microbispora cellulosiformans TaxID=2614688 RepID=A0A5J5KBS1_9ACTN|nr:AMP-binding protein [Microbispora cellulosiformans]KAA9381334.1 AMP-binding protein [Microbispora cellulosiformans]
MPTPADRTLAHVLADHAAARPGQVAYEYLHEDGRIDVITYGELWRRACGLAARLPKEGPALLLYPPGLDLVAAVWACFLAGVPAVPTYPPLMGAADRIAQRFARILADSGATSLLADPAILALIPVGDVPLPPVISEAGEPVEPETLPRMHDVALVQYTSGSTGQPKGVVLDHANLIANIRAISDVFRVDRDIRVISWLPPYHDMGLIGCILTPGYGGFPVRLMSPVHFLRQPLDWLRQISEMGVTHTGGPNFAYDLCVRRARGADLSGLDLSQWRLAFNGAEPIRPGTLRAFAERFAGNGFRPEAFLPCYGLAEATLIVTGRHFSPADGVAEDGRVDCGPAVDGHSVVVVDDGTPAAEGENGEIWVRGPSVCRGYWNDSDDRSFGELDGERYLRTGDLGYLRDGHLFVTGRSKDVLIQSGVNFHAHDLESAAVDGHPALRPTAAAFMVERAEGEQIVLAVELARAGADVDRASIAAELRTRVLAATGARVDIVVVCPPGAIPRTTSGKVQRSLARTRYVAGELRGEVIGDRAAPVERFLAGVFAAVCDVGECAPTQSLSSIGGDSVRVAEIAAILEDALALPVPIEVVLSAQSPREVTARLMADWSERGVSGAQVAARIAALTTEAGGSR